MIQPSSAVRNLGFYMDRYNSCAAHVNLLCKNIFFDINGICSDRRFLFRVILPSVVTVLVSELQQRRVSPTEYWSRYP